MARPAPDLRGAPQVAGDPPRRGRAALSVDMDGLDCYYAIHGLGPAPRLLRGLMYERALPRARALFAELGAPATWFVVGQDLDLPSAKQGLRACATSGDEVANHSQAHRYDLARRSFAQVQADITGADQGLRALGFSPRGFRSPGYDISPTVVRVLEGLGYAYDASILPAPAYYGAKVVAMALGALRGRPSRAVLTEPRALWAPRRPYRLDPAAPWRRGAGPLVEVPMAVSPWLRLPLIGTMVALAPWRLGASVPGAAPALSLEFHGIDFCDAILDELPSALLAKQPDLRVPWVVKAERYRRFLRAVGEHFEFCRLAALAALGEGDEPSSAKA